LEILMSMFLVATFVYRFANGLLFLAVAWNLVRSTGGGAMALALSAIAGFLPAILVAPFARRLLARGDIRKMTLYGIGTLSIVALVFVLVHRWYVGVLVVNFFVLAIFFLLEGAWDGLLASIVKTLPAAEGDKLNSRQSAATQAGLMLGGLPIGMLTRAGGAATPFIVASILYVVTIWCFVLSRSRRCVQSPVSTVIPIESVDHQEPDISHFNGPIGWPTLATLALVWPCLALVNMVVPLVANSQGNGTVEHAAILDAAIGLGMGFIGIAYERLISLRGSPYRLLTVGMAVLVPLPFVALLLFPYALWPLAVCFFLSGIGFGMFRISLRKQLITTQPAHRVGQVVASCNGYGVPVLALAALLYAQTWRVGPVIPLVVFVVFGALAILSIKNGGLTGRALTPATAARRTEVT
jgi:Major Facilitator Superfamily